jgi:hypothetical protein
MVDGRREKRRLQPTFTEPRKLPHWPGDRECSIDQKTRVYPTDVARDIKSCDMP